MIEVLSFYWLRERKYIYVVPIVTSISSIFVAVDNYVVHELIQTVVLY